MKPLILVLSLFSMANSYAIEFEQMFRDGMSFEYSVARGQSFKIDIRDNKILVVTYHETAKLLENWCTSSISNKTLVHVVSSLKELGSQNWKQHYSNDGIRGGFSYKLTIRFMDKWLSYTGLNKQPDNFDKVIEYMHDLALVNGCEIKT